jgi:malate synthase
MNSSVSGDDTTTNSLSGEILSPEAIAFLEGLQRRHGARRLELLERRKQRFSALEGGVPFSFLDETASIRAGDWQVAPPAPGLIDRRVEITGPTDRKMAVNALNSGASVWLADFEDANTPLWENMVQGQVNLQCVLDRNIDFEASDGKSYRLNESIATIVVRPRGWHLTEKHFEVDHEPISASLFDFGLFFFHWASRYPTAPQGPFFYLPKLESHLEARLWNDVFVDAQRVLDVPVGTIRATVLIETIPAAFEMEEILYELRQHSSGLNAGRWDYLFSVIKKFRNQGRAYVLPDRNTITMTAPFMRAYTDLLVQTCHRRGAHAIGGMAAFIPNRRDAEVNALAMRKVRDDKVREAGSGFDGSWVAHPDLVPLCREVFDGVLGHDPNQIARQRQETSPTADQLLDFSSTPGSATEDGLRNDVTVALQYLSSWLRGTGAVAIFNLMEDAATAEIARSQVWQWVHNKVTLDNGKRVTAEVVRRVIKEELEKLRNEPEQTFDEEGFDAARLLFEEVALSDDFEDFLTIPAYRRMP